MTVTDAPLSDDELAALAMAADVDAALDDDAVPLWGEPGAALLPAWYMPSPMAGPRSRPLWLRAVVAVIAAFLAINAYGLCRTYGPPGLRGPNAVAWH